MSSHIYGSDTSVATRTAIRLEQQTTNDRTSEKLPQRSLLGVLRIIFSTALPTSVAYYLSEDSAGEYPITPQVTEAPFQTSGATAGAIVSDVGVSYDTTKDARPGGIYLIITPDTSCDIECYQHFTPES